MNDIVPTLPAAPTLGDFFRGLSLPFRAVRVMVSTPKLLGLSLLSGLVTAGLLVGIVVFFWPRAFGWADALIGTGSWRTVASAIVGFLFFSLASFVSALTLPNLVLAPLQDPLSEATEQRCGDFVSPPFDLGRTIRGTAESLGHTLLRLVTQVLGLLVLLPLNLVPGAGSVANPMARHLYPFGQVLAALRRRLTLALGFGAALYVMLWVPVLNFFLMPVAVVAGTLLYRALRQAGAVSGPPEAR
ncbi:MAG: EI24 domain-containing protein [Myxococcaceae bacterium]|nr:EI24 domain-containing protein [Myxococcaceae bacterium]